MLAKAVIGVLAAVVLVVLYRGMRQEQAQVDPAAPLDSKKILATLHTHNLSCNTVTSYTPLGKSGDGEWDAYLARCGDGGRYIYFENAMAGKIGAMSCADQTVRTGYRCPD